MILQSKLSKTAYPTADPKNYLTGDTDNIDPVLLGRLAYVAKVTGAKIKVTNDGGYRSSVKQAELYALYKAGKLQSTAAKPGTSWHEYSLAIDTSTYPIRGYTSGQLKAYGLCKPIRSEGWHIQPIETNGKAISAHASYAPSDLAPQLKTKFGISDATITYLEGYEYALSLAEKLLAGTKAFAESTIEYLKGYKYWDSLKEKLGL